MLDDKNSPENGLFRTPRNEWERKELKLTKEAYKYSYKDPRSVEAFCQMVYFYREEIGKLILLSKEFERIAQ